MFFEEEGKLIVGAFIAGVLTGVTVVIYIM